MSNHIDTRVLCREWIHSSEEDSGTESVFRPADYDFPLTRRPRESFRLAFDGILTKGKESPADRLEVTQGTWLLKGDEIFFYNERRLTQKSEIISIEPGKLVLKNNPI